MSWSKIFEPNERSYYDHILLECPLGTFVIEWKSWKESPDYTIMLNNDTYIGCEYTLEDAKQYVVKYIIDKNNELKSFIDGIC